MFYAKVFCKKAVSQLNCSLLAVKIPENYFTRISQEFRPVDLTTGAKQLFKEDLILKNNYFEEQLPL